MKKVLFALAVVAALSTITTASIQIMNRQDAKTALKNKYKANWINSCEKELYAKGVPAMQWDAKCGSMTMSLDEVIKVQGY